MPWCSELSASPPLAPLSLWDHGAWLQLPIVHVPEERSTGPLQDKDKISQVPASPCEGVTCPSPLHPTVLLSLPTPHSSGELAGWKSKAEQQAAPLSVLTAMVTCILSFSSSL